MIASIFFEYNWQWWLYTTFAFVYGMAVMAAVVFLLIKSAEASVSRKDME